MAIIELQDPLSTEIQSTTVSGAVDALNVISKGLDLGSELLEKVQMYPVEGLEPSDPRRIYQVENGNRLWLSSPNEPVIYVNDSEISQSENEFSIDYIGGSITFDGDYRPGAEDVVTVSCAHISSQSNVYGGSEIKITFTPGFLGQQFTVTGGENESYSGVVDSSLKSAVRVKGVNTTYTVSANSIAGKNFTAKVEIGPYYGQYEVTLSSFSATIEITTEPTAAVTVNGPTTNYNATANGSGKATVIAVEEGAYSVTSTYKNANSDTKTVQVSSDGETYKTTNTFITLTVTVDAGSTVKVKNGATTLTETSNGTAKFWLPNTGEWNVSATLEDKSSSTTVNCNSYKDFYATIMYVPDSLNDCTWEQISELSAAGTAKNYFSVGDSKTIHLNGQVPKGNTSGYDTLNFDIDVFIIGFDHNPSVEGTNKITFCLGKKNGKLVALSTSGNNSPASQSYANYQCAFCIWPTALPAISWDMSTMYSFVLSNDESYGPSNPRNYSLMAALPSDLRSVMKSTTKYVRKLYGIGDDSYIQAVACENYMFLFSEREVRAATFTSSQDYNYQKRYEYFLSGNSFTPSLLTPNGTIDTSSFPDGMCPIWTRDSVFGSDSAITQNEAYLIIQGSKNYQMTYQYMILPIMVGFCV